MRCNCIKFKLFWPYWLIYLYLQSSASLIEPFQKRNSNSCFSSQINKISVTRQTSDLRTSSISRRFTLQWDRYCYIRLNDVSALKTDYDANLCPALKFHCERVRSCVSGIRSRCPSNV